MTIAPSEPRREISLEDRYRLERGTVYLGGLQALVRVPIEQNRRDRAAGLRIGTFISGYPGSPLGTYDMALQAVRPLLEQHDIVHLPAANEELAATAISGTQMLDRYPHSRFQGVNAFWYGKGPGVDRSGDALKHGNFAGTSEHGSVAVLAGEDHEAKSSTMPFQDDYAFLSAGIPVLYPGSVAEFLEMGLHAVALSRFSGCWVALKLVGQLCDGGETVELDPERPRIVLPIVEVNGRPFKKRTDFTFFPGTNVEMERHLYEERHAAARAYGRANDLNRVVVGGPDDRLAIVATGKSFADVRQALLDMRLDDAELRRFGIRLVKVGMLYPLDGGHLRELLAGVPDVLVVEEKRGFFESQLKEALYGWSAAPRILGKLDENGAPLFPLPGGMDGDVVAERLGPRLLAYAGMHPGVLGRLDELKAIRSRQYDLLPMRTPNYCSGCPHNVSTKLLEGDLAWGSPGCHSFASIIEQPQRHIESMTQYGGEGLPWIGLAPFTDRPHIVQNVGDGSLFHSSYLNIRFAAAVEANITYKILYNGFIANTGAQSPTGAKSVPDLVRLLETEGVKRIAVVTKHPETYEGESFTDRTKVYPVDDYDEALRTLEQTRGTTVLLYDEMCANERRRRQKRGKLPTPNRFVVINEDVCENCGHCGELTNCMSLHKVDTEYGPKTQIHTSSCNQDYSCLKGDCPSFVTVETQEGTGYARPRPPALEADAVPEPVAKVTAEEPYHVYIPGVGGTGVLTLNALLAWAALIDGRHVLSYDQTGAAQKWGPVLSSLAIADRPGAMAANKVGIGKADLYLAFDLMAGATKINLDRCDPQKTVAVINTTLLPSGEMIRDVGFQAPVQPLVAAISRQTRRERNVAVEARHLAEGLFGDYMAMNVFALGSAYQAGLLPLSASAFEVAVRLNGVAVDQNIQAFRYGRLAYHDPDRVRSMVDPPPRGVAEEKAAAAARLSPGERGAYDRLLARCTHLDAETQRLLAVRVADLIQYQDAHYAESYVSFVLRVAERERAVVGEREDLSQAVARYLYKLMAYKDEYEVARLQVDPKFERQTCGLFVAPEKVSYNLHPPLLRSMGLKKKIELGPWFRPAMVALKHAKPMRGTPLDPFGYAHVRREERRLIPWYRDLVERGLAALTPDTYGTAIALAEIPDQIRGYEDIKLRNIRKAEQSAADLLARLESSEASPIANTVS